MGDVVEAAVLSVNDLKDGEMREVMINEKKVLVSRVKGRYYATSHLCTHYKAPLVKGTLSEDGRLVCPWHAACFNVGTGDIEDAPALDHLARHTVRIEGDKVIVTAKVVDLEAGRRRPKVACKVQSDKTFVVVGGGAAGAAAIEQLRESGFTGRLVLVSKENCLPLDRIKLSKTTTPDVSKMQLRDRAFYDDAQVELMLGTSVTSVDTAGKTLHLDNGERLAYDRLLLATGGTPRNFWSDSKGLANVLQMRGEPEAAHLQREMARVESLGRKPRVVVIGSSFIGMEAAAAFVSIAESVSVVGMEKVPFERVLGARIGAALQRLHESKGVKFFMESVVDRFEQRDGLCTGIVLRDTNEVLPADLVVIGAGVAPTTDFLRDSGIPLQKDGSIEVDETLAVVGVQDVWAAGDIARFPYPRPTGIDAKTIRVEHFVVAENLGRDAAKNMAGIRTVHNTVPFFWTGSYGKSVRYCGHALKTDDIIFEGSPEDLEFVAYFCHGEDVVGVASMSRDPVVVHSAELMRLNLMPKASEIRNGKKALDVPLGTTIELPRAAPPAAAAATATPPAAAAAAAATTKRTVKATRTLTEDSGAARGRVLAAAFVAIAAAMAYYAMSG